MKCPKCACECQPNDKECPRCGIVYEKWETYIAKEQVEEPSGGRKKKLAKELCWLMVGVAIFAFGGVLLAYMWPPKLSNWRWKLFLLLLAGFVYFMRSMLIEIEKLRKK